MSDTLEARFKVLEARVMTLEDIEAIQKVELAYGYYLEHLMYKEIADLWTDDGYMEWVGWGRFIGKEEIKKQWKAVKERFYPKSYMHMAPQIMGYVTVDPNGKTGYGRWYAGGGLSGAQFLYENTYVKEVGVWKLKAMHVGGLPQGGPPEGIPILKPGEKVDEAEMEQREQEYMGHYTFTKRISRAPRQEWAPYIRPFHYKHPVTGEKTSEDEWNKAHPAPIPPGGEKWTAKS